MMWKGGLVLIVLAALCLAQVSAQFAYSFNSTSGNYNVTNTTNSTNGSWWFSSHASFQWVASFGGCNFYVDAGVLFKEQPYCVEYVWGGSRSLNLNGKGITTLPPGVFAGVTIDGYSELYLDLSNNLITSLSPGTFGGLSLLYGTYLSINLEGNQISSISADAFQWSSSGRLQYIRLDNNRITTLPAGLLRGLDSLNLLDLAGNQISTLHSGFCRDLTYPYWSLRMSNNQISSLPNDAFHGCWNIVSLDLSNNRMTTLPSSLLRGLRRLRSISLQGNNFVSLPSNLFNDLYNLQDIILGVNPGLACIPASAAGLYVTETPTFWNSTSGRRVSGTLINLPMCPDEDSSCGACSPSLPAYGTAPKFLEINVARFAYQECTERRSWESIITYYRNHREYLSTGDLGALADDTFNTWVCFRQHPCVAKLGGLSPDDAMCYVYNEKAGTWYPWGLRNEIELCRREGKGRR
jgi:hypothetical protein